LVFSSNTSDMYGMNIKWRFDFINVQVYQVPSKLEVQQNFSSTE
jgi:hypothetical protein